MCQHFFFFYGLCFWCHKKSLSNSRSQFSLTSLPLSKYVLRYTYARRHARGWSYKSAEGTLFSPRHSRRGQGACEQSVAGKHLVAFTGALQLGHQAGSMPCYQSCWKSKAELRWSVVGSQDQNSGWGERQRPSEDPEEWCSRFGERENSDCLQRDQAEFAQWCLLAEIYLFSLAGQKSLV